MPHVALWHIAADGPQKLAPAQVDLEAQLEEWIERDPSLLQGGLAIVGRQVRVEGGSVDLLALDLQGRWVVVEIKRGTLYREAITQALDYAASIASLPYSELEQKLKPYLARRNTTLEALLGERGAGEGGSEAGREVVVFLVGTGAAPGLERMAGYLTGRYEVPLNVVLYNVFQVERGRRILVRELSEAELVPPPSGKGLTAEDIAAGAARPQVGEALRVLLHSAREHDLYPRAYKRSVMFTPPGRRDRMLFTARVDDPRNDKLLVYVYPPAFVEFYDVKVEDAEQLLVPEGWVAFDVPGARRFAEGLGRLFAGQETATQEQDPHSHAGAT